MSWAELGNYIEHTAQAFMSGLQAPDQYSEWTQKAVSFRESL